MGKAPQDRATPGQLGLAHSPVISVFSQHVIWVTYPQIASRYFGEGGPWIFSGGLFRMESAMFRSDVPLRNVPRVELDQRAREARLRLERVERSLLPRPAARLPWLWWRICVSAARSYASPRKGRTGGSLSDWPMSFSPAA